MTRLDRDGLPVLGVVGQNYLRETGFLRLREESRIAFFGLSDSVLHRMADYSCPLRSMDLATEAFEEAVCAMEAKGIAFDGLLAFRDHNVTGVAEASRRRWSRSTSEESLECIARKHRFRAWLNAPESPARGLHQPVEFRTLSKGISRKVFEATVSAFMADVGEVIMKPDRGSCSYHVMPIAQRIDVSDAWALFHTSSKYRGGDFVVERRVRGKELAVETIVDEQVRHIAITGYLKPDHGRFYEVGHFAPVELGARQREAIHDLTRAIHHGLGLTHGITHMELLVPRQGVPAVVEMNLRLAGDLTQELHRLTGGVDFYRIAGRLATGRPVSRLLAQRHRQHKCALIRFHRPVWGKLDVKGSPASLLRSPDDRFGLIMPADTILTGGDTNDHRSAYVLLAGRDREALDRRARDILSLSVHVKAVKRRAPPPA